MRIYAGPKSVEVLGWLQIIDQTSPPAVRVLFSLYLLHLLNKLSFGNLQTLGTAICHRCDYGARRVYASGKPTTAHNSDGGEG